jgi:hypothetical protein
MNERAESELFVTILSLFDAADPGGYEASRRKLKPILSARKALTLR